MLLKSLKLNNIRSYTSQEIEFPQGALLLSGDIGSGKSTILLAIEFALFGIMRGDLSGSALLRNGAEKGFVELAFELNGRPVTIHRKLRRTKESVEQDAGHIIKDDMKKDATPQELKTEILELIGYPKDLLTKSKSLVYRYTVYTPQEAMKQIILDDKESRLDILRKVFDIDKYKRIKENTQAYAKSLREQQKEYAGMIFDLEDKKKLKLEKEKASAAADEELAGTRPQLDAAKKAVSEKKEAIAIAGQKMRELAEKKKQLAISEAQIKLRLEQGNSLSAELDQLIRQIEKLKQEAGDSSKAEANYSPLIQEKGEAITQLEKQHSILNTKLAEIKTRLRMSEDTKKKIFELDQCPLCLQQVNEGHKHSISEKEDAKIKELTEAMDAEQKKADENLKKAEETKKEREELREKDKHVTLLRLKREALAEKEQKKKSIEQQQEKTRQEIRMLAEQKTALSESIESFGRAEKEAEDLNLEFEELMLKERELDIQYHKLLEKKESIESLLLQAAQEVERKEGIRKELVRLQNLHQWMVDFFIKTIDTIEKQVMTRVYHEFNELFQSWFSILVEDETMQARLDECFTPIVQQNGYDIEIEHLSGGEKTACALAYRLALNKVINDLITTIQTKDIIILDEPTDGFSSEQLDKIRDVLDELGSKQVIIVSHEQKIEGFVDHVLRISKNEHVSQIF